tara:strand:+ start:101 stop:1630 length:1530 start_codon:yes stop_codon:yes gene_type:complete
MAFLFNEKISGIQPEIYPQQNTDEEYATLIKKEQGITNQQKKQIDSRFNTTTDPGVSVCGTVINTLKSSVGAGILSFPYGFYIAGWLGGTVACFLITLPILYCFQLVGTVRRMIIEDQIKQQKMTGLRADPSITEDEIRRLALESRVYLEYNDLAELSVGTKLKNIVTILVLIAQLGCCAAYVIFMGNNLSHIGANFGPTAALPRFAYVIAVFPLILGLSFIKSIRGLTPFAFIGTILLIAGFIIVTIHGLNVVAQKNVPIQLPPMLGNGLILFIGIAIFSMESVTQMPVLQASMTKPSKFPIIIKWCIFTLMIFYIGIGIGGAALFGKDVDSVITRNMGATPMGHIARALFCAMLLLTFPFQMFPASIIVGRYFTPKNEYELNERSDCLKCMTNYYVVRTLLCVTVIVIACIFDNFGQFLSLIGYPCMGTLSLVLPPLMILSLDMKSKNGRLTTLNRTLCWIIMCVGAVGCLCGTVWTIADVAKGSQGVEGKEVAKEVATTFLQMGMN